MRKFVKIMGIIIGAVAGIVLLIVIFYNGYYFDKNRRAKQQLKKVQLLSENGHSFRDLNKNGKLDVYEDNRENAELRIDNLMAQMTIEEKAGLMWHPPIGIGDKGEILETPSIAAMSLVSTYDAVANKKINHFNLFKIPKSRQLAEWYNSIQKIAEQTRLGIPVSISSDPRHGINNFIGSELLGSDFSKWPEPIGLAATGDSSLVVEFGRIANAEYRAVGIRVALHPMADLATEPRWARINGTFGEDAALSAKLIAAYINGFQGDSLDGQSVACMTKHWPGGGPQGEGEDAHFGYGKDQLYPGKNFEYHVEPFKAAFAAKTAMIMPYYGVPVGQTSEDVGMSFNKEIITELLRKKYQYDGVVCTDWGIVEGFGFLGIEIVEAKSWGVENLTVKERILKVVDAGVDQFGGNMNVKELLQLVNEGLLTEERIDVSVRRLLRAKFKMGLFDNPFVDLDLAEKVVGNTEFIAKGKLAQRRSIVLLKNQMNADSSFVLPLKKNQRIYVENIDKKLVTGYGTVTDSLKDADVAILHLQTPWEPRNGDFIEKMFHQGELDFDEPELNRILKISREKPTIICMYLDRPAVIPEIAQYAAGLFGDFGLEDDALLDVIFGGFNPTGKLPFELPASMAAVKNQKEDVPFDSGNPLFPFGYGLSYK
jgi:beta-glucosidase